MKKCVYLFLLAVVMMVFSGCEGNNPDGPKSKPLKYAAINAYDNTKSAADMLLACSDNSYMVCELDHDGHGGYIYISSDYQNEQYRGVYLFIDSTGTPTMLRTSKLEYFFKNVTETSCDIVSVPVDDKHEEYWDQAHYYLDLQFPIGAGAAGFPRRNLSGESNPFSEAFGRLVTECQTFDRTWDVHMLKAAIPFLAKVTSFGITAVSMISANPLDWTSGITALYQEAAKSGLVDDDYVMYVDGFDVFISGVSTTEEWRKWVAAGKEGKFTPSGLGLSLLASALNEFADYGLTNVNKFNERSKDMFSNREYFISLSTYCLKASSFAKTYTVKVASKLGWRMDTNPGCDWMTVRPDYDKNELVIELKENTSDKARDAIIVVSPPQNHPEIPTAILTVQQEGVALTLSPTSIVFDKDHLHNAIYVEAGSQVREWHVVESSVPEWLSWEKGTTTVFLDVNSIYSIVSSSRDGEVGIEATLEDGSKIIKYCSVYWRAEQNSGSWDGTSWIFSGTLSFTDGPDQQISMGLSIHSVATHSATLSIGAYSDIPCSVSENGTNGLKGSFSIYSVSGSFTATRTGETTATCQFEMSGPGDGGQIEHAFGTLTGTLVQ